jgi:hypothetical protein
MATSGSENASRGGIAVTDGAAASSLVKVREHPHLEKRNVPAAEATIGKTRVHRRRGSKSVRVTGSETASDLIAVNAADETGQKSAVSAKV